MSQEEWAISTNEEDYSGCFGSEDEAIAEGKANEYSRFFVGKCVKPAQPEVLFDGDAVEDWLKDHVWQHEDYCHDWADGQVNPNRKQLEDLAERIRPVIAEWLDRHGLRPRFFLIDPKSVRCIANDGEEDGEEA